MSIVRIGRRTLLRGLVGGAAVAIGLPLLDRFLDRNGRAYANGDALPRRFGLWFWGNGVLPVRWVPTTTGAMWQPSPTLMPLLPVRDRVTVVSGLRVMTGNERAHDSGAAGVLTGSALLLRGAESTFAQPTLDQVAADEIGGLSRFRSLELGVAPRTRGLSSIGPDSRNPPELSPRAVFARLFGPDFVTPGDHPMVDPKIALRRSVLDGVMEDSSALSSRVGAADRMRLDQHFTAVRDLELRLKRLQDNPPMLSACKKPAEPSQDAPGDMARPPLSDIHRAHVDLLTMALACDQARVFSMWFSDPVSDTLFPDATDGHHRLTHDEPGEQPQVQAILLAIMEEFRYFVEKLSSVQEGDATLLDRCAVLATTDCSYGRQHSVDRFPILVAGNACGALKQGIHVNAEGDNVSKVGLSLLRAVGIQKASFGVDAGHVTDGLSGIEA